MRMDDVGVCACAFFIKPAAGILADCCMTAAQGLYRLFNWAGDRLPRRK